MLGIDGSGIGFTYFIINKILDFNSIYCYNKKNNAEIAMLLEFNFNHVAEPNCQHCGHAKGSHRAQTYHCPISQGIFPQYRDNMVYKACPQSKENSAQLLPATALVSPKTAAVYPFSSESVEGKSR